MAKDLNGKDLLEGVEPLTEEALKNQGHRWTSCPDYQAVGMTAGQSLASAFSPNSGMVPVVVMVCRCGVAVMVPMGAR